MIDLKLLDTNFEAHCSINSMVDSTNSMANSIDSMVYSIDSTGMYLQDLTIVDIRKNS